MQNKYISYIIAANVLWSLIPVIVFGLFNEISIMTIIFLRFFVSAIVLLILAILITYLNNKYSSNKPLKLRDLFKFAFSKNKSFFNLRYGLKMRVYLIVPLLNLSL